MKVEDVEKAIDLLYEYHFANDLLKKADETTANVATLFDKIKDTNNEVEQFQYRKEIVDSINKLISNSKRDRYSFECDVLTMGLGIATTKLECRLKNLKTKIELL